MIAYIEKQLRRLDNKLTSNFKLLILGIVLAPFVIAIILAILFVIEYNLRALLYNILGICLP